jgi:hypothetical protein
MKLSEKEQYLRNELGRTMLNYQRILAEKKQMHADLVRQREDMKAAIDLLKMGTVRDAIQLLEDTLAYRERTKEPRKTTGRRHPSDGSDAPP